MSPMFKRNKHTKKYYSIIRSAQRRRYTLAYGERHHIIPKFCGGSNDKSNIVLLTARNHYRCHKLLPLMVKTSELLSKANYAWAMMARNPRGKYKLSASEYAKAKAAAALEVSKHRPTDYISPEIKEIIARKNRERSLGKKPGNYGTKSSPEMCLYVSIATREAMKRPEVRAKIIGPKSDAHRQALSEAAKARVRKQCPQCGGFFIPQMLKRWHGDRCLNFKADPKTFGRK